MIKLASDLVYSDINRYVKIVSTRWQRKPLPVNYDSVNEILVFDKPLPDITLDSNKVAFSPFSYEGVIRHISFKSDGTVLLTLSGRNNVHISPTHEIEFS